MSTNKAKTSMFYSGVKLWNRIGLPVFIRNLSYKKFIIAYKQSLIENYKSDDQ